LHVCSATWAPPGSLLRSREKRSCLRLAFQVKASAGERDGTVGTGEITKMADADEAPGQDVLAKAAQKLGSGERHDALLVAVGIVFPPKAYVLTIEAK
jgi:hypothetical protein